MISIVIPAYNEEKCLLLLLNSIKKQDFKDYEIIVSDSSKDDTKKIAKKYGCKIVKGGTPGVARNKGAKIARYDLLFLDADTILPKNFLKSFVNQSKCYDLFTCSVNPLSNKKTHIFYYKSKNWLNKNNPSPHISGQCFFIKKSLFNELMGFDESLFLGEEHDLAKRAKKLGGKIGFSNLFVYNSPRRIEKEGFFMLGFKSLYSEIYRILFGKVKSRIINYDYNYGKKTARFR